MISFCFSVIIFGVFFFILDRFEHRKKTNISNETENSVVEEDMLHLFCISFDAAMMTEKVPETAEILFYYYKPQKTDINQQWIDWAVKMLKAGYDTEYLAVLAGEDLHCNFFEFTELTNKIFAELQIDHIGVESVYAKYAIYLINRSLHDKEAMLCTLGQLKDLYWETESDVYKDFSLLDDAIREFKDDCDMQWFWKDEKLTKDNYPEYVENFFKEWLENNLIFFSDENEVS